MCRTTSPRSVHHDDCQLNNTGHLSDYSRHLYDSHCGDQGRWRSILSMVGCGPCLCTARGRHGPSRHTTRSSPSITRHAFRAVSPCISCVCALTRVQFAHHFNLLLTGAADWSTGADWWHHGHLQLRADGHVGGHGSDLWLHLPRRGTTHTHTHTLTHSLSFSICTYL